MSQTETGHSLEEEEKEEDGNDNKGDEEGEELCSSLFASDALPSVDCAVRFVSSVCACVSVVSSSLTTWPSLCVGSCVCALFSA